VELCANKDLTRYLLLADDTCLAASGLSDPQCVLDVCSQGAAEVARVFRGRATYSTSAGPRRVPTPPCCSLVNRCSGHRE
jgi:hypothetical protein